MLRVNLISWDNGVGLSRDLTLLGDALNACGASVAFTRRGRGGLRKLTRPLKVYAQTQWHVLRHGADAPRFDLNIMLEHIWPEYLDWARASAFIPNPEWTNAGDVALLDRVAIVLAKTQETRRIFGAHGVHCEFIGFTSADRLDESIARTRAFFHLAGRSENKGTQPLITLWRQHPEWPLLTVVQSPRTAQRNGAAANIRHVIEYLPDAELKRLQNQHRFHLCPSETEGFGHYIVEAMSVAALPIVLDAAPMNELVRNDRGVLVATARSATQHLATTHFFDSVVMERAVAQVLAMSDAELDRRGAVARTWFETNHAQFASRLQGKLRAFAVTV